MPRRPVLLPKDSPKRFGTHYDTIPHGNCGDPARCDCCCAGCLKDWDRYRDYVKDAGATNARVLELIGEWNGSTVLEIAGRLNVRDRTVRRIVERLKAAGKVVDPSGTGVLYLKDVGGHR